MTSLLSTLDARILAFQQDATAESFDELAAALVEYQYAHVPPLARWWDQQGLVRPIHSADEIPAVPTDAFQVADFRTTEGATIRTFQTSGTTSGQRGAHARATLAAYDAGATLHFRACVPHPPHAPFVSLTLDPRLHPESSLSHMIDVLAAANDVPASYHLTPSGIHVPSFSAAVTQGPVICFGTAFAFAHLLEVHPPCPLPHGSVLIETGGFKGRSRELDRTTFHQRLRDHFSLPADRLHSEYSMTELSSQLYSLPGSPLLVPPHWLRVQAVDPATLALVPPDTIGLLRFVDLANTDTVVAVQTSDLGSVDPHGRVQLLGRAPGATLRGCSLTAEELLPLLAPP
jgi:hypothetical protein